jgi:hypothetical protein
LNILLLFALVFLTFSCKKKEEEFSLGTRYVGQWKLSQYSCNSNQISFRGLDEYLDLSENTGSISDVGSQCYNQGKGLSININKAAGSFTMAGGQSACSPANCKIPFTLINDSNGQKVSNSLSCTAGQAYFESPAFTMLGDQIVTTETSNSTTCTTSYSRVNGLPNPDCYTFDDTSFNLNSSFIIGISANNVDKGAAQFRVLSSKTLKGFRALMTSQNVVTASVRLYSGGATPELGSLIGTATLSENLGATNASVHYFEFTTPITLSPATDYYLVFTATGGGSLNLYTNTANLMLNGQTWSFTTGWNSNTYDLNMGFVFQNPTCP